MSFTQDAENPGSNLRPSGFRSHPRKHSVIPPHSHTEFCHYSLVYYCFVGVEMEISRIGGSWRNGGHLFATVLRIAAQESRSPSSAGKIVTYTMTFSAYSAGDSWLLVSHQCTGVTQDAFSWCVYAATKQLGIFTPPWKRIQLTFLFK